MKRFWRRLVTQGGFLAVVTAFMIVPALLGVVMIYDAGTIMVARTGAYDTAYAVAQLVGAQRWNQVVGLTGGCDTAYLPARLMTLTTKTDWAPFIVESVTSEGVGQRIKVRVSVEVNRPFFGTERYIGEAWLVPSKVFVDGSSPC